MTTSQLQERILVTAHGHPDFSLGGGEIAAYNLFKAYQAHQNVENTWYLGRADRGRGANGTISLRRPNEYLWEQAIHDWDRMKAAHQESLTTWFADLIGAIKPTIVHSHHYAHLGLEHLRVIKNINPDIRIFMTLHEYMAICQNNGQMVKTGRFQLCSRESYDDCRQCFPHKTAEDFWLRKHYFQSHFKLVDAFVAPSEFLRQRYIQWGIDANKIIVIENGQAAEAPLPPRAITEGEKRNRFAYFGQITQFKGLDVILEALTLMTKSDRKRLVVEVHGANLEWQPPEYQEKIERLRKPLIEQGVVRWVGPYQPHELRSRMAGVDWVLVPSIWWENSPMVIQEAYVCGRPLLCSDIGGMAEKILDGVTGLHVSTGNPSAWASKLLEAADNADLWAQCRENIQRPMTYSECADAHLKYFANMSKG